MKTDSQQLLEAALQRGDYQAAQAQLRHLESDSTEGIVLRADVLRNVGRPREALDLLSADLVLDRLPASHRGRAFRVKGEAESALGLATSALHDLETSVLESEAASQFGEAALACLSRFTLLVNVGAEAEGRLALEQAKRAVSRSADARLLAWLHARVGQAHAQHGLAALAVRHLETALRITEKDPHLSLTAFSALALCGAEFLLARYRQARSWALKARDAANEGGLQHLDAAASANLALLEYRLGNFARATDICTRVLQDADTLPPLIVGPIMDTLACVFIAEGRLLEAQVLIARVEELVNQTGDSTFLSVDTSPTVASYLVATDRIDEAERRLSVGIERATKREDAASLVRLRLLRAEVRILLGKFTGADEDLRATEQDRTRRALDIVALESRVRGLRHRTLGNSRDSSLAFARSLRLFRASGDRPNVGLTKDWRKRSVPDAPARSDRIRSQERSRQRLSIDLTYLTSLVSYPELLGLETCRVLSRVARGVSAKIEIGVESSAAHADHSQHFFLGTMSDTPYHLTVDTGVAPDAARDVAGLVGRVLRFAVAAESVLNEHSSISLADTETPVVGKFGVFVSAPMQQLLKVARRVACTDLPVLVLGETGVGKEVLAAEIHASSPRANRPFIPFNVTAVARDLLESQLFGARKGSFTGATHDTKGLLREADGGTVFLDEIGEMSLELQPKLLRFVEQGEIQPVGERPQHVDVRIIAATNASLQDLVRQGRFREDLYHRLRVVPLTIPPLRERREEIATLARHFIERHAAAARRAVPDITPKALERLVAADWPGNVRQLSNELRRIVALLPEDSSIEVEHLSPDLQQPQPLAPMAFDGPLGRMSVSLDGPLDDLVGDVERAAIERAMALCGGNISEAARRLGITRKGLYLKRQRLGMDT